MQKKDNEISALNGKYSGTFYYSNLNGIFSPQGLYSSPVTVTFSGNNYASTSNSNQMPAGGSGRYKISGQQAEFKDTNNWTADFDWGLILNGDYSYQIKSDSLILNKTNSSTTYEYWLKRTN